jgi:hypothetical protein
MDLRPIFLVKSYSKGKLNPFLFNTLNEMIIYYIRCHLDENILTNCQMVKLEEFNWMDRHNIGAYVKFWGELNHTYPQLWTYDIKSAFPSILMSDFRCAIREGVLGHLSDEKFQTYINVCKICSDLS